MSCISNNDLLYSHDKIWKSDNFFINNITSHYDN